MKTQPIIVKGSGEGISEALAVTEVQGKNAQLDNKSVLHLRLLAEELFGMLKGIAGEITTEYWLDFEGKNFELHLKSNIKLTNEMREQFFAASSTGNNYATVGFMGKIRVMIAGILLSAKETLPYAMINTVSAQPMGGVATENASVWSLANYKTEIEKDVSKSKEASEVWDELEKSIVANIADDFKVKIIGNSVEILVLKKFD